MTRQEVEAGLTDGSLVRGVTRRYAHGTGEPPTQGALLLPDQADRVAPPVRGREVLGWLVVGEANYSIVAQDPLVGARPRRGAEVMHPAHGDRPPCADGR
jgi:hypothetical protein